MKKILAAFLFLSATGKAAGVTYVGEIQPILRAKCAGCHGKGAAYPFADSYAQMQRASKRCRGETVGVCVGLAVQNEVPEGTRCRTVVVKPFHREGWRCLADCERKLIATWIAAGLPEQ